MREDETLRRVSYVVLCAIPVLIGPLTGIRSLRVPILHEALGILLFGAIAAASWWLARPGIDSRSDLASVIRASGALLLMPTALIALFWVGLATPWDATASENKMRYAVLLTGSIGVTVGFVLLKDALTASGERLFSTIAFATGLLSGAAYVVWTSFQLGDFALRLASGSASPALVSMNNVFDALLFAAGALAYAATAAFAHALTRVGWLGRYASRAYVALNLLALALLMLRGVSFPGPSGDPEPWYTRPGFVVGIPAVPWLMPYFLGVLLLRRAGGDRVQRDA
jgi:hypothetical protein